MSRRSTKSVQIFSKFTAKMRANAGAPTRVSSDTNIKCFSGSHHNLFLCLSWVSMFRIVLSGNKNILEIFNDFDVAVSGWLAEKFFEEKYSPMTDSVNISPEKVQLLQDKTNELRDLVAGAEYLDSKHRMKLLARIEKFQRELHKVISSKDAFMAGWAEVNDMMEDTGKKAKPIVDRFREIISAVRSSEPLQIEVAERPKQIINQKNSGSEE